MYKQTHTHTHTYIERDRLNIIIKPEWYIFERENNNDKMKIKNLDNRCKWKEGKKDKTDFSLNNNKLFSFIFFPVSKLTLSLYLYVYCI